MICLFPKIRQVIFQNGKCSSDYITKCQFSVCLKRILVQSLKKKAAKFLCEGARTVKQSCEYSIHPYQNSISQVNRFFPAILKLLLDGMLENFCTEAFSKYTNRDTHKMHTGFGAHRSEKNCNLLRSSLSRKCFPWK